MTPILFINSHAIYSIGFISNEAWDEESQSYAVDVENELVTSLAQLFARGYTVSVKATIESSDGTTETVFTAKKVERQETPDGNVVYITFDNGATLTDTLFTISYAESGGGGGGAGVFRISGTETIVGQLVTVTLDKTFNEILKAFKDGFACRIAWEETDYAVRYENVLSLDIYITDEVEYKYVISVTGHDYSTNSPNDYPKWEYELIGY